MLPNHWPTYFYYPLTIRFLPSIFRIPSSQTFPFFCVLYYIFFHRVLNRLSYFWDKSFKSLIMKNNKRSQKKMDLQEEVMQVFHTMELLTKNYGISYLIRILQGNDAFPLKNSSHTMIETFGCLRHHHRDRIRNLLYF